MWTYEMKNMSEKTQAIHRIRSTSVSGWFIPSLTDSGTLPAAKTDNNFKEERFDEGHNLMDFNGSV